MKGLVGFILAPHVLCVLFAICYFIVVRDKNGLKVFIISALYPVSVPVRSVYLSFREIFLDEDWTEHSDTGFDLNDMKVLKMYEHIGEFYVPNTYRELQLINSGEALPQLIMMSVFIVNNGGPDEHPFGVVSGKYKKSPGVLQNVNHS